MILDPVDPRRVLPSEDLLIGIIQLRVAVFLILGLQTGIRKRQPADIGRREHYVPAFHEKPFEIPRFAVKELIQVVTHVICGKPPSFDDLLDLFLDLEERHGTCHLLHGEIRVLEYPGMDHILRPFIHIVSYDAGIDLADLPCGQTCLAYAYVYHKIVLLVPWELGTSDQSGRLRIEDQDLVRTVIRKIVETDYTHVILNAVMVYL